jgi:hypothetical protein
MTEQPDACHAIIRAAQELGLEFRPDVNNLPRGTGDSIGWCQQTRGGRRRASAAVTYLRPAKRRPNLRILTNALVHRVVLDGKRAVGVEFSRTAIRDLTDFWNLRAIGYPILPVAKQWADAHADGYRAWLDDQLQEHTDQMSLPHSNLIKSRSIAEGDALSLVQKIAGHNQGRIGFQRYARIVISAESEARRSPAQHFGRIMRGVWAGSLRLWSRRVSLRNLQENPVAGESGPDAAGISRSAYVTACWALSCPISPYLSRIKLSAEHTGRRAVLADQGRTGNSSRTSRAVI